ncbi:hypothetical protein A0J48_013240 [Sphaerospermopsis aphanizomenoides BCCUSP55]|uniref:hypothetical protein n=1 Tax=Sphaerospermopsis aphanizomenoides TaxID=459663 RepID=UPI0019051B17|nr:hypothetical protein [Sphaerospermopsis aphanizomenoides]MBK1988493.1 hypothetical protein [Sphaerospermopsis aphanizomenoides BCCUSP55]
MKLIKKSDKLLQETQITEETKEQSLQSNFSYIENPTGVEQLKQDIKYQEPNYVPIRDNPIVLSVGNTGWQVSEIWKDIRLDNF